LPRAPAVHGAGEPDRREHRQPGADPGEHQDLADGVQEVPGRVEEAEIRAAPPLAALGARTGNRLLLEAVLAGGLGLVAVVASILLTLWFGRRLTGELTTLHDSAQQMAAERLPRVVQRLRDGQEVDVGAESPLPPPGRITEIARVADAFESVQRT